MAASRPTFAHVFADPKLGLRRSAPALAKATGRSLKDAREFLKSTSTAQAQKAWRRPPASAYSTTGGPSGEYQADTIYLSEFESMNKRRMAILTKPPRDTSMPVRSRPARPRRLPLHFARFWP
jgi:hypothetical protein